MFPKVIHVHMRKPFGEKRYLVSQSFSGNILQGTNIQNLIPVLLCHKLRPHLLLRHGKCPGQHTGIETSPSPWDVNKSTSRTHTAEHCFQMGISAGCGSPLYISKIRTACHTHLPVTEILSGDPVQCIITVFDFVILRHPFPRAVFPSSGILNHQCIASLNKAKILFFSSAASIWCTNKHCRKFRLFGTLWQIHIRSQLFTVSGRHPERSDKIYRINRSRLKLAVCF